MAVILLIESDEILGSCLKTFLESEWCRSYGHKIILVQNQNGFLEKIAEQTPDIIFVDKKNSSSILQLLKNLKKNIPLILMSMTKNEERSLYAEIVPKSPEALHVFLKPKNLHAFLQKGFASA